MAYVLARATILRQDNLSWASSLLLYSFGKTSVDYANGMASRGTSTATGNGHSTISTPS